MNKTKRNWILGCHVNMECVFSLLLFCNSDTIKTMTNETDWKNKYLYKLVGMRDYGMDFFKIASEYNEYKNIYHITYVLCSFINKIKKYTSLQSVYQIFNAIDLEMKVSNMNKIPFKLSWLKNLNHLSIDGGNFYRMTHYFMPDCVGSITITCSNLKIISPKISLSQLFLLDLRYNQIITVPSEIGLMKTIGFINLCDNKLISIPTEISLCAELEELYIDDNYLNYIPDEFTKLMILFGLTLDHNELISIPDLEFKDLEELTIYNNKLIVLNPKSIIGFNKTTEVYLNNNKLIELPKEISYLNNLQYLSLLSNNLNSLPHEFSLLVNLESLCLCRNNFEIFPMQLYSLINLKCLAFNYNKLKEIPENINCLVNLKTLSLVGNIIKILPDGLYDLVNLRKLYVCYNQIKNISDNLVLLNNLKILFLNHNNIEIFPVQIFELDNLQQLSLNDNKFSIDDVEEIKLTPNLALLYVDIEQRQEHIKEFFDIILS